MEQLIRIENIPIAFELKVHHARLEYKNVSASADLEISRNKGGLQIKSSPVQVNLDTFQAQQSIRPSAANSIRQYAQQGRAAVYEATATYASDGHLLMKAKLGDDVLGQLIQQHTDTFANPNVVNYNIGFIPQGGVDIDVQNGDLTIDYQLDKMNFDWKAQQGSFEFIPGDIEISISQRPAVNIEYIGGPIYVPASYEPLDVKA
mgnify:FL=1